MFSYAECALMADAVSHIDHDANYVSTRDLKHVGIKFVGLFQLAHVAYQGALWQRGNAKCFSVRGTYASLAKPQNLVEDWAMKSLSRAPWELIRPAAQNIQKAINPPYGVGMLVGSSLGGSAVQALGLLYGLPFVTINAPAMRYNLMRRKDVRVVSTLADTLLLVGGTILRDPEVALSSTVETLSTMGERGSVASDDYVKATAMFDQDYDAARLEVARGAKVPLPVSTATIFPETQLGFNIAHPLDRIHTFCGQRPIGRPYRAAPWVDTTPGAKVPALYDPRSILYYHDSRKMAEYLMHHNWGSEQPVKWATNPKGLACYAPRNYHLGPIWENTPC